MKVLEKLNKFKDAANQLAEDVQNLHLPEEDFAAFIKHWDRMGQELFTAGSVVESFFQEMKYRETLISDILDTMEEANHKDLYNHLIKETKRKIAEEIVENPKLKLFNIQEFKSFLVESIRKLSDEKLVKLAYTQDDIIRIGDMVLQEGKYSDLSKYDKGMEFLLDQTTTPSGREEAIALAEERILDDAPTTKRYLLTYYGLRK